MHENLLQFIWQFRYFNTQHLQTAEGENLTILQCGTLNKNQGPDFLNARIKINETIFAGNIELHVKSSDWILHKHSEDQLYRNIILHVVWQHDKDIPDTDFPTLELQSLTAATMLKKYEQLMSAYAFTACESFLPAMNHLQWTVWKDRLTAERLQRKSQEINAVLHASGNDWSETFWRLLAKNFGTKINGEAFFETAKSLPLKLLAKNKHNPETLESLLFGQSGLLENIPQNDYGKSLRKEYDFLQKKYGLQPSEFQPVFLRMRPQNFPTIRLAQLADLIYRSDHLFSKILTVNDYTELSEIFRVKASDYWDNHYTFDDEEHPKLPKYIGKSMIDIILINTVVPILFSYGEINASEAFKEKAVHFLSVIKSEENAIIKAWRQADVISRSAFDSQALIELKNNYCDNKFCLSCAVGNSILKK